MSHFLAQRLLSPQTTSSPELGERSLDSKSTEENTEFSLAFVNLENQIKLLEESTGVEPLKGVAPLNLHDTKNVQADTTSSQLPSRATHHSVLVSNPVIVPVIPPENTAESILENAPENIKGKHDQAPQNHESGSLLVKDPSLNIFDNTVQRKHQSSLTIDPCDKSEQVRAGKTPFIPGHDISLKVASAQSNQTTTTKITKTTAKIQEILPATLPNPDVLSLKQLTVSLDALPLQNLTIIPVDRPVNFQLNLPINGQVITGQISNALIELKIDATSTLTGNTNRPSKIITVQLSPAELGRVQIQFSFDGYDRVTANIIAENPETNALLKQKSNLLFAQLKLGGFDNIDLSFDTKNQSNFSSFGSGGSSEHNTSAQKDTPDNVNARQVESEQSGADIVKLRANTGLHMLTSQLDIIL